jgi:hypothetical protein
MKYKKGSFKKGKDFIPDGCTLISSYSPPLSILYGGAHDLILFLPPPLVFPHTRGSPWRTAEDPWAIVRSCGTPARERDGGIPTRERGGDPGAGEVGGLP